MGSQSTMNKSMRDGSTNQYLGRSDQLDHLRNESFNGVDHVASWKHRVDFLSFAEVLDSFRVVLKVSQHLKGIRMVMGNDALT